MVQELMKDLRCLALILAVSVFSLSASAQEVAPPQLAERFASATAESKAPRLDLGDLSGQHKFFDRQQLFSLYAHSGMRIIDTVKTCRELSHGGVEEWIPTQSCGGVAAWQAGSVGLALGVGWLLHRRGNHRLERLTPWIATAASAAGWTKSVFNIH